jgi:entericidin B
MLKKSLFVVVSLLILSSLTACNTTRGDVSAGGQAIQRTAN